MIAFEKIQGRYFRDILAQPRAIEDTIASLSKDNDLILVGENLRAGRLRRVVLTGMGGSYQILHPLHLRLVGAGFDSVMAETSELLYSMPALLDAHNVVITVSQSGASAEIVKLMDREGPLYIGITNTPGSPLDARSQITVHTRAGEEGGVSCKTAVTSMVALRWVGEHLCGDPGAVRSTLERAPSAVEQYVSPWRDHVAWLVEHLAGVEHLFLAGRGASLAAVGLGAMVQKEAAHFHAEGMSSAALRHGPFEMLGPESFVVVFEGDGQVRELNHRLVLDVRETGAGASLCGPSAEQGPFALPEVDEAIRPVLELLPAQMISLALGYLKGREPGKFERITKVTTVE